MFDFAVILLACVVLVWRAVQAYKTGEGCETTRRLGGGGGGGAMLFRTSFARQDRHSTQASLFCKVVLDFCFM